MTAAAPSVRPGPATYLPKGMARRLTRSALVIFDEVIWGVTGYAERAERITDRFISEKTGYAIRTVQAAIHDLCSAVAAVVDGVEVMLLERSFRYGPREECGRELRITAPQVVPVEKQEETPSTKSKARAKATGKPAEPAEAEKLAAASAAVAKAAEDLKAEPAPDDAQEARRIAAELHRAIHHEGRKAAARIAQVERRQGKVIDPEDLEPAPPRGFIDPGSPEPHRRE